VAYQNAKVKYSDVLKARGTNPAKAREETLAKAKSRSFCSACGKKGHWHKDVACTKDKGKTGDGAPHVTHLVFYTDGLDLDTVVDCACSRTLAGVAWCKKYLEVVKKFDLPLHHDRAGGALQVWWTAPLPFDEGDCGNCGAMVHDQNFHRLSSGAPFAEQAGLGLNWG